MLKVIHRKKIKGNGSTIVYFFNDRKINQYQAEKHLSKSQARNIENFKKMILVHNKNYQFNKRIGLRNDLKNKLHEAEYEILNNVIENREYVEL